MDLKQEPLTLAQEIATFLGLPIEKIANEIEREKNHPGIHVAEAWQENNPQNQQEIERFYAETDAYIYDLMVEGLREPREKWREAILGEIGGKYHLKRLLDFGGGVGNEALYFASKGFKVTYYDLEGLTANFARYRIQRHNFNDKIKVVTNRKELGVYDIVICLEVLEHIVDPLETLSFLRDHLEPEGVIFLTHAFHLCGSDYPSHLPGNQRFAKSFFEDCFRLGLTVVDRIGPEGRIFVLKHTRPVDIVIPVYNGYNVLKPCLESLRNNPDEIPHRLILINDGSTDERVLALLERAEKFDGAIVIHHDRRWGFAKSINQSFDLSSNDVVILNSDTLVTSRWLTKLVQAAYRHRDIGTVTPLSNNCSIYSLPVSDPLPTHIDANRVGEDLERFSPREYPNIPVGVGFCMFIKREVINEVGHFDDKVFGIGYGEENDFCLRATLKGYRHVLADDTYVHHHGGRTFVKIWGASEVTRRKKEADLELFRRYPFYQDLLLAFQEHNPLILHKQLLHNFSRSLLNKKRKILYVLHNPVDEGLVGGTEFHVADLIRGLGNDFAFYLLVCREDQVFLYEYVDYLRFVYFYRFQEPLQVHSLFHKEMLQLAKNILSEFKIELVHIHHFLWNSLDIIDAAADLGIPILLSIHDYYLLCPNYNLINEEGVFCNLPSNPNSCRRCLSSKQLVSRDFSLENWRENIRERICKVRQIIYPSRAAKKVFELVYTTTNGLIIEHGLEAPPGRPVEPRGDFSVCFLGYPAPQKGRKLIEKAVPALVALGVKIHFLGSCEEQWPASWKEYKEHMKFHGFYSRNDIVEILRALAPHVVCLPSPWPETFGYVLSEVWAAGIPVIVPPLGALAERVRQTGAGAIMKEISASSLIEEVSALKNDSYRYQKLLALSRKVFVKPLKKMIEDYRSLYYSHVNKTPFSNKIQGSKQIKPLVSIIIPCCNASELTSLCINSILDNTQIPYELIIVDNASTDGTLNYLNDLVGKYGNVRLIRNPANTGFGYAVNQGIAIAQGDYLVILNNDVIVPSKWLEKMLIAAQRAGVGIVGPRSNNVAGRQKIEAVYHGIADIGRFAEYRAWEKKHTGFFAERAIGFCMLVKREVIERIGGFDVNFGPGNFEDDDFCIRAQLAGYQIWIADDCYVHHFGSQTFKSEGIDYISLMRKNFERLKVKWDIPVDYELEQGVPYNLMLSQPFSQEWHYCPLTPEKVILHANEGTLLLAEKRSFHLLMVPDWDEPEDKWLEALRIFVSTFKPYQDIGLIIRIDPLLHPDVDMIIEKIRREAEIAGIDLQQGHMILIVNDLVPPRTRGVVFKLAHAFIKTVPDYRFNYTYEEAKASGLAILTLDDLTKEIP